MMEKIEKVDYQSQAVLDPSFSTAILNNGESISSLPVIITY